MKKIIKIINFIGDNVIKICAVLVVLILGVYILIYIPYRDAQKMQQQETKERLVKLWEDIRRENIATCQEEQWEAYSINWEKNCEVKKLGADCGLPTYLSDNLEETRDKGLKNCIEINK